MPEFIIQSRITPRKAPGNIIQRPRLLNILTENKNKNLILISSPAGYGKTTLVQSYLTAENTANGWYHVTDDINNFYTFISYIIHSLKKIASPFGNNSLEVIESLKQSMQLSSDEKTVVVTVLGTFINDFLTAFKEDVFLVIDDLHNAVPSGWLKLAFNTLIEDLPENLHIIITTRSVPDFDLTKLKAKRNLLHLEAKDLNFNNEEIANLLENIYAVKYTDSDIELLEKKINGWITGIHLILQAYGKDFGKVVKESRMLPENIFDFFANDIFTGLDEETRDFLVNTSLFESFSPDICNWLLNIENSKEILDRLTVRNIFIECVFETGKGEEKLANYSYHALFRQFLLAKAGEIKSEDEINIIANKIFEYYKNNGDSINAANYALLGKSFKEAIPMIIKEFDELFEQARYDTLWKWISALPEEYFKSNPFLLFSKGRLLKYFKGEIEEAYTCFEECLKIKETSDDENLLTECSIQYSEASMLLGKIEDALKVMGDLKSAADKPSNKAKVMFCLSRVNYRVGPQKYDEILNTLAECSKICEEYELKNIQTDVYNLLGNVYQDRGEFVKSLFYYELVVKNVTNIFRKYVTITNIILLHSSSGNFLKAKDYLNEAEKIYSLYPSILFERYLLRTSAIFRFEAGDYEECIKIYEKLIEIELKSNIKQFIFWYYLIIGEAYSFLNKNDKVVKIYELASNYLDKNDEYEKIEYDLHKTLWLKKNQFDSKIEKSLLSFLKYYETNDYVYSKVQIMFQIADFYYKKNLLDTALNYLSLSLNISSEKQYVSYLEQNFTECRHLFDYALANKIQADFIRSIHESLFEKVNYSWLSDECRKRLIPENKKLYDIKLNTFGGIELFTRGEAVSDDKWIRKKSKLILVYLLLNQGIKFTKDKMMDMFFQELSVESAENIFHQAITNIRNVLKPAHSEFLKADASKKEKKQTPAGRKKTRAEYGFEPSYVIYEDKILRLNSDYYYKTDAVEFNKLYSKVKSAESGSEVKEQSAKQAIGLYKGEFLAGYYEPWIEELRESYSNKYIDLCNALVEIYNQKNQPFEVTIYAEKLLEADKLNEEAYVVLIDTYVKLGNINMAKNKFAGMLKIFDEELGEKPSKSTLDEIQNILLL